MKNLQNTPITGKVVPGQLSNASQTQGYKAGVVYGTPILPSLLTNPFKPTPKPTIQPDWLRELLGIWSHSDIVDGAPDTFASVSPMFARLGFSQSTESDLPFSDFELQVAAKSIERLQTEHPRLWDALHSTLRQWHQPIDKVAQRADLAQACGLLTKWIDVSLGSCDL